MKSESMNEPERQLLYKPRTRSVLRLMCFGIILLISTAAYAQYGTGVPGGGSTAPSYSHGKAIGIGVGAAALAVGAVYLITHHQSKVTGCVRMGDDGIYLNEDKTGHILAIAPGDADVRTGERLQLKGRMKKNATGGETFFAKTVAKDLGSCAP